MDAGPRVVLIPAHNVDRFIGSTVLTAFSHADRIVVADEGSIDATAAIAQAAGAAVITHPHALGRAASLRTWLGLLRGMEPWVVVTVDADRQPFGEGIPQLIAPVLAERADTVIGSCCPGTATEVSTSPLWDYGLNSPTMTAISQIAVTDPQSGFLAPAPVATDSVTFQPRDSSVTSGMVFAVRDQGLRLAEVAVLLDCRCNPERAAGASGAGILGCLLRVVRLYQPLLLCGAAALLSSLATQALGGYALTIYHGSTVLAAGDAMLGVLLASIGVPTLSTRLILHALRELGVAFLLRGGR